MQSEVQGGHTETDRIEPEVTHQSEAIELHAEDTESHCRVLMTKAQLDMTQMPERAGASRSTDFGHNCHVLPQP